MTPEPSLPKKRNTWIWVLLVGGIAGACCCLGSVAVALPGFTKFGARSKQAECKMNLKSLYTAEKAYWYEAHKGYSTSFKTIGFDPEAHNRYAYFVGTSGHMSLRSVPAPVIGDEDDAIGVDTLHVVPSREILPSELTIPVGLAGTCPQCEFTAACMGNLDDDETLDVWSISSVDRSSKDGPIPAGTPFHDVDDLK